jgi:hypothetical protein
MTPEARKRDLENAKAVLLVFGLPALLAVLAILAIHYVA